MRATESEFAGIDLRAHSLLAGVPLHDVWVTELSGGGPGRSILDVQALISPRDFTNGNPAVRVLFGLRRLLGWLVGWDREPARAPEQSLLHRLSAEDRAASLVAPGTLRGPFRTLFVSRREAISEIQNATVHAFSVFALEERAPGYRLWWAVYVRPVGRITSWYMRLIDPFRRLIIYPVMLRRIRAAWAREAW